MSNKFIFPLIIVLVIIFVMTNYSQIADNTNNERIPSVAQSSSIVVSSAAMFQNTNTNTNTNTNDQTRQSGQLTTDFEQSETSGEHVVNIIPEIALSPKNVPTPFLAFGKNVRLTWEDYQFILDTFEKKGSPIRFDRNSTEDVLAGSWWIEHRGYNDNGEPLFVFTDLNSFTEKNQELTEEIYDYDLAELNNDESWGVYNFDMENFARDALSVYNSSADSITCRLKKCLLKTRHIEQTDFDIISYTEHLKEEMKKANPDENCSVSWSPLKPQGNIIAIVCGPT